MSHYLNLDINLCIPVGFSLSPIKLHRLLACCSVNGEITEISPMAFPFVRSSFSADSESSSEL